MVPNSHQVFWSAPQCQNQLRPERILSTLLAAVEATCHCVSWLLFLAIVVCRGYIWLSNLPNLWQPIIAKHLLQACTCPNTFSCKLRCTCGVSLTSLKSR